MLLMRQVRSISRIIYDLGDRIGLREQGVRQVARALELLDIGQNLCRLLDRVLGREFDIRM